MSFPSLALLLCLGPVDENLICLPADAPVAGASVLYSSLQEQAYAALDKRRESFEQLVSPDQVRDYQRRQREFFLRQLGGLPQRTPLNARTVGRVSGDGYRVEKVIFESRPDHHVTATLYLPPGAGPHPGVVVASGHSRTGKSAGYNQRFGIAMARNGMAALCYDPIGQGERSQILDEQGRPVHGSTTREHFIVGVGSILIGANTAQYRVWDGIRSIDYLASRDEIDEKRIGFTGCSGGGTLTSYVMALDDRVLCAAPACYLTTLRRLIETIGPQDAEQNIYGQIQFGMDHPDYVLMRAPRPTLISATTGDFFDIAGTWENYRQAKRIYTRLGHAERVDLVEAAGKHGVQPANLLAITRWMRRWLLDKDDAVQLGEIAVLEENELQCTKEGQVLRMPGERSVFALNREIQLQLAKDRRQHWNDRPTEKMLQQVRQLAGVRRLKDIGKAKMIERGRVERDGYHIDKLVLQTADEMPLPALTFHPKSPKDGAYLYVHGGGKHADSAAGGPIEKLVDAGYVVVAVDLRGYGETAPEKTDSLMGDWRNYYLAYLLGKPLVGLRTEDVLACGRWVANYQTTTPRRVHLIGVGTAGVPALHAAALEPELFATLQLRDSLQSWTDVINNRAPQDLLGSTIHGALRVYDLPDLLKTLGDKAKP